jgi:hypothetical protein
MNFQKRYFYLLLLSCVVLTVFSSCKTIDLKKSVFDDLINNPPIIEGERQEPKKPEDIQYYVSKKVTLKLISEPPTVLTVDYLGNLIEYNWIVREKVSIASDDLGKLLSRDKNGYLLIVGFEENSPECFLRFRQEGDDERYFLILDDIQKSTITYGDSVYEVRFSGDGLPYLKIKKEKIPLEYKNNRQVPGWPVYR